MKTTKTIFGLILLLLSIILFILIAPAGFVLGIIYNAFKKNLGEYFKHIAISIDQGGNVILQNTFNLILIKEKKEDLLFGNEDDTISSVLGKNQIENNLSKFGSVFCKILDLIDKDHCKNSIERSINNKKIKTGTLNFLRENIKRLKLNKND